MGIFVYCFVIPAYAGMILDRALADNSIAMTESRSMNDRQFRLNARRFEKEKGFFDIAAHGLPGYVEAYGKRIDAKTVWDVVRKSYGCSGEDIRLCACFGAVEDENGMSIAQELAIVSKKRAKAATDFQHKRRWFVLRWK